MPTTFSRFCGLEKVAPELRLYLSYMNSSTEIAAVLETSSIDVQNQLKTSTQYFFKIRDQIILAVI